MMKTLKTIQNHSLCAGGGADRVLCDVEHNQSSRARAGDQ